MSSYKCPTAYKCISRHSEAVRTDSNGDVRRKYKRQQHRRESDGKRQRGGGSRHRGFEHMEKVTTCLKKGVPSKSEKIGCM